MSEIPQPDPTMIPGEVNDGNPDYIEHHPDAVVDPAEAEYMAHATDRAERDVAHVANQAIQLIDASNEAKMRPSRFKRPVELNGKVLELGDTELHNKANHYAEAARGARTAADEKADAAQQNYRLIQQLENIKKGESSPVAKAEEPTETAA